MLHERVGGAEAKSHLKNSGNDDKASKRLGESAMKVGESKDRHSVTEKMGEQLSRTRRNGERIFGGGALRVFQRGSKIKVMKPRR